MKIYKDMVYKVIEFGGGIVISSRNARLPNPEACEWVEADRAALVEWLLRYLEAREAGYDGRDAHHAALKDAIVVPRLDGS